MNLYEACLEKFGVITAVMILADFSGFMADFNRANEEELKELIAPLNKDLQHLHFRKALVLPVSYAAGKSVFPKFGEIL